MRSEARKYGMQCLAMLGMLAAAPLARAEGAPKGTLGFSRFQPSPAGDAFFGVASASADGHLLPRAQLLFDYADKPLRIFPASGELSLVSAQGFLRVDASLALWNKLLLSADFPVALLQQGETPNTSGITLQPPTGVAVGDLRLGARGNLHWDPYGQLDVAVGAYFSLPTAAAEAYTGQGALSAALHAVFSGTIASRVIWSASPGIQLYGSETPTAFTFGLGAAGLFWQDRIQVGPELLGHIGFGTMTIDAGPQTSLSARSSVNMELLFGAKARVARNFVFGLSAGPGLSSGMGTPAFRAIGMIGYSPPPDRREPPKPPEDSDHDGVPNEEDACPAKPGEASADLQRNGCPMEDSDNDGILDTEDACPKEAGQRSAEPKRNGCPYDSDNDGIADINDACPYEPGGRGEAGARIGCPGDRDGDGIVDSKDVCPDQKGLAVNDPKQRGCPEDVDGDHIPWPADACPLVPGTTSPDRSKNGCTLVEVKGGEIVYDFEIRFQLGGKTRSALLNPVSDEQLRAVTMEIALHQEIELIEIQGHTDDSGSNEQNRILSEERARAVMSWLVAAGTPAEKLRVRGYGPDMPIADNRIFDGREQNRRVVLKIVKRK